MIEKLIIDTDPGVDDATAITICMFNKNIDIKLITTICGNVGIETTTRNALHLVEKFNKSIPVAKGATKPLKRQSKDASLIHGKDGLGAYSIPKITRKIINESAIDKMYEILKENPGEITILELAPQTNLANLFIKYPDSVNLVKQIIFEGGSPYGKANIKPHISFNISFDPEAADVVMTTPIKKTLVPSEMGRYLAAFSAEQVEIIKNTNSAGSFLAKMFEGYKSDYIKEVTETNDLSAAMYLLFPNIFSTYNCDIEIDLLDKPGRTIITENPNGLVTFVENVNRDKFFNLFLNELKNINF